MKYRLLGRTGLQVSEIGFGAWGIGGYTAGHTSYGETDDDESRYALARAFDMGINFYDTSSVYGYGHSEELIGQVFAGRRDRVVIATKAGFAAYERPRDYSSANLRRSLEGSLRRLRTDYIDLLQLHNPTIDVFRRDPEILTTLAALNEEGKIRVYGISVKSPEDGVATVGEFGFPTVQVNLNMMDLRAANSGLFVLAAKHDAGIIARTPLCFGFLSGGLSADTSFAEGDHRNLLPRAQIERWIEGACLLRQAVAVPAGQTQTQFALRFCLSFPQVSTVIPGMLTADQVVENTAASDLGPLAPTELEKIVEINRRMEFFVHWPQTRRAGEA